MDATMIALGIIIGVGFGLTLSQWSLWRHRAVTTSQALGQFQQQLDNAKAQFAAVEDERTLHHETLQQAFDYINDNGPWGTHDVSITELRNTLLHVLKDSTVGRV